MNRKVKFSATLPHKKISGRKGNTESEREDKAERRGEKERKRQRGTATDRDGDI
jgi:hypothetical protein